MLMRVATFDIDGTLTLGHGWYCIASLLGRLEEYRRTTSLFRRNKVDENTHLRNLLNLAAGVERVRMDRILEHLPLIDNIGEGVQVLKKAGIRPLLLTHNPPYVCEWYIRRFGFDGFLCAEQPVVAGIIQRADDARAGKADWIGRYCRRERLPLSQVIHAGDSASDIAVFEVTGGGVAVNTNSRKAIRAADAAVNTTDMMDIVSRMMEISERLELFKQVR
ncbi:MAG: haloacid dehalogenase-like hydrolase [Thermoplasmata archaeon YP2-bin.285]|uniref:phosphoserine phosphatase n=1 Tax=Candidatus Sysuiplasma superficiale TaxID=2823368 RepID=A0A8J8CAI4_9ARCH|nr:haloacid dehalogenase-like hydrolase [Candidatus Sysuiplasma superficiale]